MSSWMLANGLKLNHDKTELTCIQSRFLSRPPLDEIVVCGETIVPCISSANLGVVCKSSYFHSRNLSSIRKYPTANAAHTIVHAFISSRLDYCNALHYGLNILLTGYSMFRILLLVLSLLQGSLMTSPLCWLIFIGFLYTIGLSSSYFCSLIRPYMAWGLFLKSPENVSGPKSHLWNCQPLVLESRSFDMFSR